MQESVSSILGRLIQELAHMGHSHHEQYRQGLAMNGRARIREYLSNVPRFGWKMVLDQSIHSTLIRLSSSIDSSCLIEER